ncbi:MAG: hypothetical protein IKS37_00175 [Solobacterium sp.]|nr:hypothetical protein [Solobacterium sp.]
MARLSRTEKYRELREKLQDDTANDLSARDLSEYEDRLNRIDSDNFDAPDPQYMPIEHEAAHKKEPYFEEPEEKQPEPDFAPVSQMYSSSDALDEDIHDEYLDAYIAEVKKYNKEAGVAASENTTLNVLQSLDPKTRLEQASGLRPFSLQPLQPKEEPQPEPKKEQPSSPMHIEADDTAAHDTDTADILFRRRSPQYRQEETSDATMSKEDIMEAVQSLVNGRKTDTPAPAPSAPASSPFEDTAEIGMNTLEQRLEADRVTRQQLLNETTQMRAQLDDYEDNLSEVSDKMRHTNRILNIVLIVLILALLVIVFIVFYWIMLSNRG